MMYNKNFRRDSRSLEGYCHEMNFEREIDSNLLLHCFLFRVFTRSSPRFATTSKHVCHKVWATQHRSVQLSRFLTPLYSTILTVLPSLVFLYQRVFGLEVLPFSGTVVHCQFSAFITSVIGLGNMFAFVPFRFVNLVVHDTRFPGADTGLWIDCVASFLTGSFGGGRVDFLNAGHGGGSVGNRCLRDERRIPRG